MRCLEQVQNLKRQKDSAVNSIYKLKKALIFKGFFYYPFFMIQNLYNLFLQSTAVSTDTRTMRAGSLCFALSGPHFNGNTFIPDALKKGAFHVVSDDVNYKNTPHVTVVENVLETLQALATHHRDTLNIPIVGLTGSNGKTTTKELIVSVLSQRYAVTGTQGNLNNHIGVPLTLLSFNKNTEIGVVEMGANHQLEIAALSKIAKPNYGLITNYGKAHLEGFGGVEGIKKGKSELYDYLRESNGVAIVGRWDQEQMDRSTGIQRVLTPTETEIIDNTDLLEFTVNGRTVKTKLTGSYNYQNALLAFTVGTIFNVAEDDIIAGIEKYTPTNHRSQIIQLKNLHIIMDSYNANPSSMEVAIANLANKKTPYKIAILGDMFELGEYTHAEHQKITNLAQSAQFNEVHLIGINFNATIKDATTKTYENFETFERTFTLSSQQEATILIKGSRGMALERVLKLLLSNVL